MVPAILGMRPHYAQRVWGGDRLARLPAKQRAGHLPPVGVVVGEAWEVADLPEGSSLVEGGALHGQSLTEVVQRFGRDVVGDGPLAADGPLRFPILVKLIDAGADLSVQVHPDEAWARAHPEAHSKDESWLVVAATAGARVLHGTREGVSAASLRAAVQAGAVAELLREVPIAVGDVLRIEPGTLHAIGKGCLMLEVQEPSDTTYRVWDWGRVGLDGRPRTLHVEEALAVARFGAQAPPLMPKAAPGLPAVSAPRYSMTLLDVPAGARMELPMAAGRAGAAFLLRGTASLSAQGEPDEVTLLAGATAALCASARGLVAQSSAGATVVVMSG